MDAFTLHTDAHIHSIDMLQSYGEYGMDDVFISFDDVFQGQWD